MPRQALAQTIADALVALPRFLTAPLYRHWHLRRGATDAEVAAAMPGDDIVPDPLFTATRAITIAAPPEEVWPWLVQSAPGGPAHPSSSRSARSRPRRLWAAGIATAAGVVAAGQLFPANWPSPTRARAVR